MTKYLISFDDGWMDFPDEDFPEIVEAARQMRAEAIAAGVWVVSWGIEHQTPTLVAPDGTASEGASADEKTYLGGFAVVDVGSRDEALHWAARIAAACRCSQQVFELLPDALV